MGSTATRLGRASFGYSIVPHPRHCGDATLCLSRLTLVPDDSQPLARRPSRRLTLIRKVRGDIERELECDCQDVLNLTSAHLLPAASSGEERVFYHKTHVPSLSLASNADTFM